MCGAKGHKHVGCFNLGVIVMVQNLQLIYKTIKQSNTTIARKHTKTNNIKILNQTKNKG